MRLLNQIIAITALNIRSIPQRFWVSLSTCFAVALVVAVLLSFLAMANGFKQTLRGAGSDTVAIMLRNGSDAELNSTVSRDQIRLIETAPGIAMGPDGRPLVSGELYVVVDGIKRTTGTKANMPLRGIGAAGATLRPGMTIVEGRMFTPGAAEIVVGRALIKEFAGFDLGSQVKLGTSLWTVVGVFDIGGSVFESEIWGDIDAVQNVFKRNNIFQTVRAQLTTPEALAQVKQFNEAEPRLKLDVQSERTYYANQAKQTGDLIQNLGWPLSILMAIGALAGALNTMYSSVAARTTEIATLRALGFGGFATFIGTLVESLLLAIVGGSVGALASWMFFDGITSSTLGANFTQVVFSFKLTPELVQTGVILALVVGLLGGIPPAFRAARVKLVAAFAAR